MTVQTTPPTLIHLNLSDSDAVTQEEEITLADGGKATVIWKDVLVEGTYPMSPGPNGATSDPMTVIADGKSDVSTKTMSFSDIEEAHEDAAFKYVTIPTTHRDGLLDNTGYVPRPGLRRRKREDGKQVLQAALGFTEPDVKGKVQRGTVPDVSGGFFFNWMNKAKKKLYPLAMKHVALTGSPFMHNLERFPAVFASDEQREAGEEIPEGTQVEFYAFAEDGATTTEEKGTVVWDETDSFQHRHRSIEQALNPKQDPSTEYDSVPHYYVQDVSVNNTALVEEFYKGTRKRFVMPFTPSDDGVEISPATRWVEVKEAMIAASDKNFEEMSYGALREKLGVALSDSLGKTSTVYRIDEITRDNRVRIVNKGLGKSWVAEFAERDGAVWIAPADKWTALESSQPKSSKPDIQTVALSDVTAVSRLDKARQRRKTLVSSTSNHTIKGV